MVGLLCLLAWPQPSYAHAPLARAALVADSGAIYVYASWFGTVLRSAASEPFGYLCDAALGMERTARNPVWAARADGSIVVGNSQSPPRVVPADGCGWRVPASWPTDVGVAALGSDGSPNGLVAATYEDAPTVLRSDDGGENWQVLTQLELGVPITGMRVVAREGQAARVYVTRPSGPTDTALMISEDGGRTFTTRLHTADLTLVDVRAGMTDELWLLSPRSESHEIAIVRGAAHATSFHEVHRVRFFGGLALSSSDNTVWIADESAALVRSGDGGATFTAIQARPAIACLVYRGDTLWACATGTQEQPALIHSLDRGDTFETDMIFGQVDRLIPCEEPLAVEAQCAPEWFDWQRDVLPQPDAGIDASVASDAGPRAKPRSSGGCSVLGHSASAAPAWLLFTLGLTRRRRPKT